jgi:3-deoxy-manno-octulosonate cytidylyltransferase (CMP-KDO synthetase)
MKALIVIPSRYGSTRFPGKSLALLQGKPLVQWVWEAARKSKKASGVVVATDDRRILNAVRDFGGDAVMTKVSHVSGTDRLAEVAQKRRADLYVNVQGDEPLLKASAIDALIAGIGRAPMATLALKIRDRAAYENPHVVKVAVNKLGEALYFSRSPLPHYRGGASEPEFWQHVGIYAYRAGALRQFVRWKPSPLERAECLEQLRALENGMKIRVLAAKLRCHGVDTPADLALVEKLLSAEAQGK